MKAGRNAVADVKPGYKQTEAGVIPEDWDIKTINDLKSDSNNSIATGPFGSNITVDNFIDIGVPVIRGVNLANFYITFEGSVFISDKKANELSPSNIFWNDIVITHRGTVGQVSLFKENSEFKKAVVSQSQLKITVNSNFVSPLFLTYFLKSQKGQKIIELSKAHTGVQAIGQPLKSIKKYIIPLPPLREQHAIATALSDADARITSLDQLIAKKRDIRQAAMQELLTGKRRLPGFKDEWDILKMSEKSTLKARIGWQGLTTAEYLESGDYYLVTGTDFQEGRIDWSSCCFVDESRYIQDKNIQLKTGDILLTKDGTIGKVGYVDSLPGPATLNSGVFVIRPKNGAYDPQYFYYVLISRIFEVFLTKLQAGSTIIHLYQKDFVNFEFLAPEISEQRAIATVLSDMDAELAALEQQHDKMKNIKQGMMQELLTGRIRLV